MIRALRRLLLTIFFVFFIIPNVAAQEHANSNNEEGGAPIDVVNTVRDHHTLAVAGYHIPLPRIMLVEGQWFFYASADAAVASGEFVSKGHGVIVPAGGADITLDLSITSHLMYVWFGLLLTLVLTIFMAGKYKKGAGRKTEPKGWFQNLFEVTFVFTRDH